MPRAGRRIARTRRITLVSCTAWLVSCAPRSLPAQSVLVDWNSPLQTIDGFGAASAGWYEAQHLSGNLKQKFFTTSGIGLSIARIEAYGDLTGCQSDVGTNCVGSSAPYFDSTAIDIAQYAVLQGAKLLVTMWLPPASMVCAGGGGCTGSNPYVGAFVGNTPNYIDLATIEAKIPVVLASYDIPVYAVSIQNEPDYAGSVQWTAQQLHDYVSYLHSDLAVAGYSSVKIMLPEDSVAFNSSSLSLISNTDSDIATAAMVGIAAGHGYATPPFRNGTVTKPTFTNITAHVWQSEDSTIGDTYDGSMTNGLTWAQTIHNYLTVAQVNAWMYWWLTVYGTYNVGGGAGDNQALTQEDTTGSNNNNEPLAKRAYVLGQWSRFVRPGWHMVQVDNHGPLLVSAFQDSKDTESAVVVVNTSNSPVADQEIFVGTALGFRALPWITSEAESLAGQTPVEILGGTLKYTIPAQSVITFTGRRIERRPF